LAKKAADEAGSRIDESVLGLIIDGAFDEISKIITEYGIDAITRRKKTENDAG
jgi:hypothetical protein